MLGVTVMGIVTVSGVVPGVAVIVPLPPVTVKVPPGFTVKLTLFEGPPPGLGFVTNTTGVPAAAMALAGMVTVICVAVTEVGTSPAFVPNVTFEVAIKFVPFTVNGNAAPPVVALVGEIVVTVGTGLLAIVPVKLKFKTLLPPKATGLGSAWPNELTMMK